MRDGHLYFNDGYRTKRSEHADDGFRIIRAGDVADGSISLDGSDFVSAQFVSAIGEKVGAAGDIVLTTKGSVGRVGVMPATSERAVYSPQLCFFRVRDQAAIDAGFLRYWFQSEDFLRQAADRMNNTDMAAYINLADIRSLQISLPAISEQRAIAEVLGSLNDKIAANVKLTQSADRLRLIRYGALKKPDSRPLSSLARFVNGRAFTKGASGTGRVVVRIAELNSGIGGSTVFSDAEVAADHEANPGDLLFAWSGSLTLHRWYRDQAIVNQHIFKVAADQGYPLWLVAAAIDTQMEYFRGIAADKATTMGHIQRRHLDELVTIPSDETVRAEDEAMHALWDAALSAERENATLAATRDALLPQLMSGKLHVKEAEKVLEEAGV
ncbi:hypothetical protein BKD30_12320 [Tersicoccus phoenicis]|uniref:Type I restriction modification DNA specificity domain-containing protein n=2 Tax=Tersicoccus phoenicis TaxID=554083 RepID=A0A1R1L7B1_9MICC|nr:hypothetical protein BKD30_12320 [Tersicoccus phoenicis]